MEKQTPAKPAAKAEQQEFKAEQEQRGQANPPPASGQFGATEKDVQPLTPPMAESDTPPDTSKPAQKSKADDQIDPADELTPG